MRLFGAAPPFLRAYVFPCFGSALEGQTAGATETKSTGTSRSSVCQQRRGQDGVSAVPSILFLSSSSVQAIPLARVLYHCNFTITHVTIEPPSVFAHVTANITRLPSSSTTSRPADGCLFDSFFPAA